MRLSTENVLQATSLANSASRNAGKGGNVDVAKSEHPTTKQRTLPRATTAWSHRSLHQPSLPVLRARQHFHQGPPQYRLGGGSTSPAFARHSVRPAKAGVFSRR